MRADYVCTHCKIRGCRASSSMSGALLGRKNGSFICICIIYTYPLCSAAPSSKRMGLDTLLKFRVCVRLNCVRVHPGDKPYGGLSA